jgi:ATP-dependent Clp protease ATP-binding subunit ClpC
LGFILFLCLLAGALAWRLAKRRKPAPAPPPPVQTAAAAPPPKPATVAEQLQSLSQTLANEAEKTTHPRQLLDFPDFRRAVALMAAPDCDLDLVRQYATGRLWVLASAALEALRTRPDRQQVLTAVMAQLRTYPPGSLHYVLRYLASLAERPSVGEPATIAVDWWANHSMLIESFRDYFSARQALGDAPRFGDALGRPGVEPAQVEAFLASIDHPFAAALIADLRAWRATRLDERWLSGFGRMWGEASDDLLVEPAPWTEQLARVEQAVLGVPPRSVLVTGGPRMGKSSFLRLLGARLARRGWRVFQASTAELMAGQIYFGELEGRIRRAIAELDAGKRVVWCVGDLQQLARSGSHQGQAASVLDQIWPAVASGRLVLLAEADPTGAARTLQMRPSLRMHLELVALSPFDDAELADLAEAVAGALETARSLVIAPAARRAALAFGQQYLKASEAPGVVADVLKRAAQRAEAAHAKTVTPALVTEAVSQMTGLPADILDDGAPIDLSAIRAYFAARVMGQDEAVATVVDRIAMLKAGLTDPSKPIGVFLFAGPTGAGKTELAKTLAGFLFGSPDRLVRLDMSEFQTPEAVSKIVGERGRDPVSDPLVERLRKQPFSVVLLDEFEKAHSNIWDLFLQVFDDGRLTDANGHTVDFRHAIIILTSNLGAASHRSAGMGFSPSRDVFTEQQVLTAVERAFRPEFVNRLDRIVVFKPLSRALMYEILRKELADVLSRRGLKNREWAVEWEPSALDFLLDRGFSPEMGARPLKRAIDQFLLAPLAATLVEHRFPEGDQFLFVRSNGKAIEVEFLDPNAEPAGPPDAGAPPAADAGLSLAGLILRPRGGREVVAYLDGRRGQVRERLASAEWTSLKARLAREAEDPQIWNRPDRSVVFSGLNLMDRVREAAGTVERLGARLDSGQARAEDAYGDLAARLALQLWLVEAGIEDALTQAPDDAVLAVDAALEAGADAEVATAWPGRVMAMYAAWAERRRMQFALIEGAGQAPPLLSVSGFGAWRTLSREAGLHVFEHSADAPRRREVARVRVIDGLEEAVAQAGRRKALAARLAAAAEPNNVVRRYRERPAPLVRDTATGRRSGNLDQVLGGDFDLVFAPAELD